MCVRMCWVAARIATVPVKSGVAATSAAAVGVIEPRVDVTAVPLAVTLAAATKVRSPIEMLFTLVPKVTSAFASIAEILPKLIVA